MKKNKRIWLSLMLLSGMAISCQKDNDYFEPESVCTECVATFNGTETTPAQHCGTETQVKKWEEDFIKRNQDVGANAVCKRK
jgi:hypothetical protein